MIEKLKWLRKYRTGAVQTPEQLLDGVELSASLLRRLEAQIEAKLYPGDGQEGEPEGRF